MAGRSRKRLERGGKGKLREERLGAKIHLAARLRADRGHILAQRADRAGTSHTAWMLNRVINGTKQQDDRTRLITIMQQARAHPLVDAKAVQQIDRFPEGLAARAQS